jgi:hypothetical protein
MKQLVAGAEAVPASRRVAKGAERIMSMGVEVSSVAAGNAAPRRSLAALCTKAEAAAVAPVKPADGIEGGR